MKTYRFDQISLVHAITQELSRQYPGLPADHRINAVIAAANSIIAEYERQPVMASENMGLKAWLASDDTGASSLYMAYVLSSAADTALWEGKRTPRNHYPVDPDDLGRCIRLTEAVPEFRTRIHEMAHQGEFWKAIMTNWYDWEDMYNAGVMKRLHAEMRSTFTKVGEK